jgi:hypothetical protein
MRSQPVQKRTAEPSPVKRREPRPRAGDRVRHGRSGAVGTLDRVEPDTWQGWALVRWDVEGPGLVDKDGLAWVAPGMLERASA